MERESAVIRFCITFILSALIVAAYIFHLKLQYREGSNSKVLVVNSPDEIQLAETMKTSVAALLEPIVKEDKSVKEIEKNKLIDPNTATEEELITLPGIGPAIAKNIIKYRSSSSRFKKLKDLLNVKGIGEKKLHKISEKLFINSDSFRSQKACPYCGKYTRPYLGRTVSVKPYCRNCLKYIATDKKT